MAKKRDQDRWIENFNGPNFKRQKNDEHLNESYRRVSNGYFNESTNKRFNNEYTNEPNNKRSSNEYYDDDFSNDSRSSGYASYNERYLRANQRINDSKITQEGHFIRPISPVTSSTFIHSNNSKSSYDDTVEFPPNLTKLMKICSEHHSYTAKAQYCFLELFKDEIDTGEILGGNYNVYGRAPNDAENKDKRLRPLNPTKIEYLKNLKSL